MVFYFTSKVVDPPVRLFMGLDKYENEDLIKWGWPEDVWFHVDKVSSAHVYLRLNPGETIDTIPKAVIEDAAQLCKANSISGNKMNNVDVVYTMWHNLKKTAGMDVGQVSFHKDKEVYKIRLEKRVNEIVNRLNKTKEEAKVDFRAERERRDEEERNKAKNEMKERAQQEKEEKERRKKEASLRDCNEDEERALMSKEKDNASRSYDNMFDSSKMTSNVDNDGNESDDFM